MSINRVDRTRNLARTPDAASALSSGLSFDKRDQFSASAIQYTRFAGSRWASFLHNTARELNSS
jgi:hypothetical protein